MCIEIKFTVSPKKTKSFIETVRDLETDQNHIIIPNCPKPYSLDKNMIVSDLETFLTKYCIR